jgi:NDP-sugar pyrophosphorylase family protein
MHYICLAAGQGTRFGKLGRYLQKCMYPVGLKPFLEYSIRNLCRSRHLTAQDRLTLVVGHHQTQVRSYFADRYQGLPIDYLEQPEQLGTGHALYLAYEALRPEDPVIAWLADSYIPTARFEALYAHPLSNVQTLAAGHAGEKPELRVSVDGERVTKAWQGEGELYDIGLWKLSPAVLALMTQVRHGEYRMMPNLQLALTQGHAIGYLQADSWLHLGGTLPTPEANVLEVARRVLALAS